MVPLGAVMDLRDITGPDRLQRKRVIDSTALTTFFPWSHPDLQQPGGLLVGTNRATGAPVLR